MIVSTKTPNKSLIRSSSVFNNWKISLERSVRWSHLAQHTHQAIMVVSPLVVTVVIQIPKEEILSAR
jgi:hypothetical protein